MGDREKQIKIQNQNKYTIWNRVRELLISNHPLKESPNLYLLRLYNIL